MQVPRICSFGTFFLLLSILTGIIKHKRRDKKQEAAAMTKAQLDQQPAIPFWCSGDTCNMEVWRGKGTVATLPIRSQPVEKPSGSVAICAEQKKRNCLEVFHNEESRIKFDAIPREQALIQKHEVWFERAHEFQGRQTIRSDNDLVASLLC
jgi:hypothetical protein